MNKKYYEVKVKENSEKDFRQAYDYYHTTPEEEAIATILTDFRKFRFEVAIAALWKRNFIVLLSFGLGILLNSPFILLSRIIRVFPRQAKQYESITKTYLQNYYAQGKYLKAFFVGSFMTVFGLTKAAYNLVFSIGWVIVMLLRYIIIPLIRALSGFAIALAIAKRNKTSFNMF